MNKKAIYTRDEASLIVDLIFEDILSSGSTYSDLLDSVEDRIIEMLNRHSADADVIQDVFSGTI